MSELYSMVKISGKKYIRDSPLDPRLITILPDYIHTIMDTTTYTSMYRVNVTSKVYLFSY